MIVSLICHLMHTTECAVNSSYILTLTFLTSIQLTKLSRVIIKYHLVRKFIPEWLFFYWEPSYTAIYQNKHLLLFSHTLLLGVHVAADRFEVIVLEPISMWQPQCRYLWIPWCWMLITTTAWEQLPVMSLITRMNRKALIALSCPLCFLLEWLEITRKYEKGQNNHKPVQVSVVNNKSSSKSQLRNSLLFFIYTVLMLFKKGLDYLYENWIEHRLWIKCIKRCNLEYRQDTKHTCHLACGFSYITWQYSHRTTFYKHKYF